MPTPFRLYNTLTREVEDFVPQVPDHVSIYVCGMTVYDHAHVGHARAFFIFDIFIRWLRAHGWSVRFIRNYTDVDDKIIKAANENGEAPVALAARFIEAFQRDAAALHLIEPDVSPKVSDHIGEIVALIQKLVDGGAAFSTTTGGAGAGAAGHPRRQRRLGLTSR